MRVLTLGRRYIAIRFRWTTVHHPPSCLLTVDHSPPPAQLLARGGPQSTTRPVVCSRWTTVHHPPSCLLAVDHSPPPGERTVLGINQASPGMPRPHWTERPTPCYSIPEEKSLARAAQQGLTAKVHRGHLVPRGHPTGPPDGLCRRPGRTPGPGRLLRRAAAPSSDTPDLQAQLDRLQSLRSLLGDELTDQKAQQLESQIRLLVETGGAPALAELPASEVRIFMVTRDKSVPL